MCPETPGPQIPPNFKFKFQIGGMHLGNLGVLLVLLCSLAMQDEGMRCYGGKPAKTFSFRTTVRIPVGERSAKKRARVSSAELRGSRKQATNGVVFDFKPDVTSQCCVRHNCAAHFDNASDTYVQAARAPLFETDMARETWPS